MYNNKDPKNYNIIKDSRPNINIVFDEISNKNIGRIHLQEIDFVAEKQGTGSIPSTACFADIQYTPESYSKKKLIGQLTIEITAYVNSCIAASKKVDIKEFIARFNNNSDSVKLVSIQSIDLYMRRIKERDEKSTQINKDYRHPDNEQSIKRGL